MTSRSAYLLVSHGSRDCHPQIALKRLADLVQQQLDRLNKDNEPNLLAPSFYEAQGEQIATNLATLLKKPSSGWVETATLELAALPLHEQIQQFAKQIQGSGINHIKIIPLFLLRGVHVTEDIPDQIALAEKFLENSIQLELCPYLGSYPQIKELLSHQFSQLSTEGRILLSHGSRRQGANLLIEEIAAQLGAKAAYWSVAPGLAEQIERLADAGVKRVGIIPYFIFRGGIIDAIAQQIQALQHTYPKLKLHLGDPLGATPELANLIVQAII